MSDEGLLSQLKEKGKAVHGAIQSNVR